MGIRLAIVVVTLLIWGNSMRTSVQSAQQSGAVLSWMAPWLGSMGLEPAGFHNVLRKLAHFSEYGLLGVLWALELWSATYVPRYRHAVNRLGMCMLTAFLDETIQLFVPGRSGEIRDVWIDALGALAGIALTSLIVWIIHQKNGEA